MLLLFVYLYAICLFSPCVTQESDCHDQYGSNCISNSTTCNPYSVPANQRCSYVDCCCTEILEDPLLDYLQFQYCAEWSDALNIPPEIANVVLLVISALYYFIILGNIADEYFAVIMADTSDTLGVSHNISGVTFLAFGNGAPDISSSVAAIRNGGIQAELGLAALLGAAVFVPIICGALITTYAVKEKLGPKVARRPFVRDCSFLFVASFSVLMIVSDSNVTITEAILMIALYGVYVLSAILNECYSKMKEAQQHKHRQSVIVDGDIENEDHESSMTKMTNKIVIPALKMFSDSSMRQIPGISHHPNGHSLRDSLMSTPGNTSYASLAGGNYQSIGAETQISAQESNRSLARMSTEFHSIPGDDGNNLTADKLKEFNNNSNDSTDYKDEDGYLSMEKMSEILSSIMTEREEEKRKRHWSIRYLMMTLNLPPRLIGYFCFITIPLTDDEHWNDCIAIISCITAPMFSLFAFDLLSFEIMDGFELWQFTIVSGTILGGFTAFRIWQRFERRRIHSMSFVLDDNNDGTDSECSSHIQLTPAITPKLSASLRKNKETLDSDTSTNNGSKSESDVVMKYWFMILGFLSAVAWINVAANELVNILTTLGIVSGIDLAILGLTVLAWGNSIGDLVADVGVSKKGYPKMGIAASIGGPTLNVLIGIGLGCTLVALQDGSADLPISSNLIIGCLGVMVGMAMYLLVVACTEWRISPRFGIFLYFYYSVFLLINLLAYFYPNVFSVTL